MYRIAAFIIGLMAGLAAPAFAESTGDPITEDQPETIRVKDLLAEGGYREVKPNWQEINKHPLGSEGNPVRCDMPSGERLYLQRLRCPGGTHPNFDRKGSVGLGPYSAIMDVYNVECPAADKMEPQSIYMDMYHPNYQEKRAVPGFTIDLPPASGNPVP